MMMFDKQVVLVDLSEQEQQIQLVINKYTRKLIFKKNKKLPKAMCHYHRLYGRYTF